MRKTTQTESAASDGFHSVSSNSPTRQLNDLVRLVGLALYMIDPFRGAFDSSLVTDYATSQRPASQ
jgi:hypothetical protein